MNRRNSLKLGASILAGIVVAPGIKASESFSPANVELNSFWDVVKNRRSVRKFKPDPVPYKHLVKIVDAARMAPSAGNQQPWKFLIIQDKNKIETLKMETLKATETYLKESQNLSGDKLKEQMKQADDRMSNGYLSAPALIIVLTDGNCQYPTYTHWDGPLAAGYMLLAARALGYGTVFITDSFPEEITKKVFNIPDQYTRVCITPVGVPVEWPTKEKKPLDEFIVKESF
jgi:nitroreductase